MFRARTLKGAAAAEESGNPKGWKFAEALSKPPSALNFSLHCGDYAIGLGENPSSNKLASKTTRTMQNGDTVASSSFCLRYTDLLALHSCLSPTTFFSGHQYTAKNARGSGAEIQKFSEQKGARKMKSVSTVWLSPRSSELKAG